VGDEPTEARIWERAAARCPGATPGDIDGFIAAERTRERLKALQCLPGAALTIELLEGRVAVLLHDKALLDEEDILPAALLIFGKSHAPVVRNVGSRTFISPGEIGGGRPASPSCPTTRTGTSSCRSPGPRGASSNRT